jgi:hypothetical protein
MYFLFVFQQFFHSGGTLQTVRRLLLLCQSISATPDRNSGIYTHLCRLSLFDLAFMF